MAETALVLIEHSKTIGLPNYLQLVPHTVAKCLDRLSFIVEEDRDNFDYVYSVPALSTLEGSNLQGKRYKAKKFARRNPTVKLEKLNLHNEQSCDLIFDLITKWEQNKINTQKSYEIEHERLAIDRLLKSKKFENMELLALCTANNCLGFMILETLPANFAICHFWKCDDRNAGIYDYLLNQIAKYLLTHGIKHFNFEQDLGLPNLRTAKLGYRPIDFLKKYRVSLAQ